MPELITPFVTGIRSVCVFFGGLFGCRSDRVGNLAAAPAAPPSPAPSNSFEPMKEPDREYLNEPKYNGKDVYFLKGFTEHEKDGKKIKTAIWKHCDVVLIIAEKSVNVEILGTRNKLIGTYTIDLGSWDRMRFGTELGAAYPADNEKIFKATETKIIEIPHGETLSMDLVFRFPSSHNLVRFVEYCDNSLREVDWHLKDVHTTEYILFRKTVENSMRHNLEDVKSVISKETTSASEAANDQPSTSHGRRQTATAQNQDVQPTTSQPSTSQPSTSYH